MRVGLTGGIASGKSTVSELLAALGAVIVDSDKIAREVVEPGTPGLAQVVEEFGPTVLTEVGELDRAKVGEIVFADESARERLNAIVHPLVGARSAELEEAARVAGRLVINDIPLLVEVGYAPFFDEVIVVDVPVETQVERAIARGMSESEVRARIKTQASREDRLAAATYVIDNTGTLEDLRERVQEIYDALA
ncbi:dephospho-CoA kinase [Nocardioides luteus]|uniref:Dephospho-CoA kinase n=1 Tax=Nocardioides luteus TaxID=1844 RepID=A0ABQ5SS97_9ACTN|nr:dephospho-CoA kinase [Nocardioides luteus]MDR7310073.1 dephospho-CoA kinase [Nocardioides luteus]GGR65031.1 dephospho-CoA kinase [Nocardioides luteus]GLJ67018.1 dephospho-CoA kinase [Nocardioides luteus]